MQINGGVVLKRECTFQKESPNSSLGNRWASYFLKIMRNVIKLAEGIDLSFRLFKSRILRNRLLHSCKSDNRESAPG